MPVDESLLGRVYPPSETRTITARAIADFASATGGTWREGEPAPATFAIVAAFGALASLMGDEELGIELSRVVHGDQHFTHHRSIRAGDELAATLTVESLRQRGGVDFIGTHTTITDAGGELVCEARATIVHRGEDS